MQWGKLRLGGTWAEVLAVGGSLVLCMTVQLAYIRGLELYPQLAPLRLAGLPSWTNPSIVVAGFFVSSYGLLYPMAAHALLLGRRRWPAAIAAIFIVAAVVMPLIPAALLALCTVAATCRARTTGLLTALALLPIPIHLTVQDPLVASHLATTVTGGVLVAGAVGWGLYLRGVRQAADQARVAAGLRAEQARQHEREALAREMHDVLAHRLSLLSVHAGALEVNRQASPTQVAEAVGVIRVSAHQAMEDLQQVLGVLRTPLQDDAAATEPPQPTLAELPALLDQSRKTGMHIELTNAVARPSAVPETSQRTAYRIVQEALTNAHKHAPGQDVRIRLGGDRGEGLTLDVANALSGRSVPALPGSGSGLHGLSERAALIGGRLTHTATEGTYEVRATLPWPA